MRETGSHMIETRRPLALPEIVATRPGGQLPATTLETWPRDTKIEPTAPTAGSLYDEVDKIPPDLRLPGSFTEGIDRFRRSDIARELFGSEFVRIFSANREAHDQEFRRAVTDWELRRFLEMA